MSSNYNNNWYFTKKQVQKHFGDSKHEILYRRSSATFIQEVGIKLKLPQLTIATAIAYFHRFFIRHQLKDHDRYIVSTACLFLAGKVEEAHRTLVDVINISYRIKNKITTPGYEMDKNELDDIKRKILVSEHQILTTIAFDLAVEHPYKCLLEYIKHIGGSKHLCQVAWNFVNDSLRTTLCLHYPPDLISYASVYLATKFLNLQLSSGGDVKKQWWEILNIKLEVLEDISKQILDLYEPVPNGNASATSGTSTSSAPLTPNGKHKESPLKSESSASNGAVTPQMEVTIQPLKTETTPTITDRESSPNAKRSQPPYNLETNQPKDNLYTPYKKPHNSESPGSLKQE
ncbi:putative K-type cyclin [Tieghemostelium lacteum]|uniref:Putative K-type cyclin n=1 Tax=Tieghemostelium lacteum TaxID=361077 RepID=A0A151ZG72_TIELA|nr:putative K-type cyclin [Tieghemostelium lacteum]|eukprot:KYQ92971.1 putative K-type cyclin [Tieghemostelium lacteum]